MKLNRIFIASVILCGAAALVTSCDNDFDRPPMIVPAATYEANTTIAELKEAYWQDTNNYYTTVTTNAEGDSVIIAGRVVSSDAAGNLYQQIIIEDETGAIDLSVTMYDIYESYHYGQEVRINVTGMVIGRYAGLVRLGAVYNSSIGRMDESQFTTHAQVNGLPNVADVDTALVTLDELATYKSTTEGLIKWQSRLIRLDNMTFVQGGKTLLGDPTASSATSLSIKDANGSTIDLRTNNKSTLASLVAPTGTGSVTGILGYYNSSWQIFLNDAEGLQGFDETTEIIPSDPTVTGDGSYSNPWTVAAVMDGSATGTSTWVTGYIVGCIDTSDSSNYQYQFTGSDSFGSTSNILLAASADETSYGNCIAVQLPSGDVRTALNLSANPTNIGKQVSIKGSIEAYFNKNGLKSASAYNWGPTGTEETVVEPTTVTYTKASTIESGKSYIMVISGKVGTVIAQSYSYGRLSMADPTSTDGDNIVTDPSNAIVITAVDGGYTMFDSYSRYLSMATGYNTNFQLYTESNEGSIWTITPNSDGTMTVTNNLTGCSVGQSGTYTNIAPAATGTELNNPTLYVQVN